MQFFVTHDDDGNDDSVGDDGNNGEDYDRHVICQNDRLDELSSKHLVSRPEKTNNFLPLSLKCLCTEIFAKTRDVLQDYDDCHTGLSA